MDTIVYGRSRRVDVTPGPKVEWSPGQTHEDRKRHAETLRHARAHTDATFYKVMPRAEYALRVAVTALVFSLLTLGAFVVTVVLEASR
jgi:uncharacterized membrane protein